MDSLILESLAYREVVSLGKEQRIASCHYSTAIRSCTEGSSRDIPLCIQDVIVDVVLLANQLLSVKFSFVRREANVFTHALGQKSLRDVSFRYNSPFQDSFVLNSLASL